MNIPLAEKLRPKSLNEIIGQEHLIGENGPLRKMIESGEISSMIFWGPPGSGKTTLARVIANYTDANFIPYSAVGGSIKEVREIIQNAKKNTQEGTFEELKKPTILFVDEIHRFNKAQQDAFLPAVEDGTIILIGATTENPGFNVISPLISRSQVYIFNKLESKDLKDVFKITLKEYPNHKWDEEAINFVIALSDGDARKVINAISLVNSYSKEVTKDIAEKVLQKKVARYDKSGDMHYDTISAFIKSMRGSDPDATVYYLARMIEAGEDPVFIARRMVIFASEDIGNANPEALVLATSTMSAVKMIGMPESVIILGQCATYLATSRKSIASYVAISDAMQDVIKKEPDPIPLHLRNSVNEVVEKAGYGEGYLRYNYLEQNKGKSRDKKKIEKDYLPPNLKGKKYYNFERFSQKDK